MSKQYTDCSHVTMTGVFCNARYSRVFDIPPYGTYAAIEFVAPKGGGIVCYQEKKHGGWRQADSRCFLVRSVEGQRRTVSELRQRLLPQIGKESARAIQMASIGLVAPDNLGMWYCVTLPRKRSRNVSAVHLAHYLMGDLGQVQGVINFAEPRFAITGAGFNQRPRPADINWALEAVGVSLFSPGERGVRVGIFDTGAVLTDGLAEFVPKLRTEVEAYSFLHAGSSAWVPGHGAAVASLVRQTLSAGEGKGKVWIVPYRVLNRQTCGTPDGISKALVQAANKKIDIVCAAWIVRGPCQIIADTLSGEARNLMLIAAVPNDCVNIDECRDAQALAHEPHDNILITGAVDENNNWFGACGEKTIDVTAPGDGIHIEGLQEPLSGSSFATAITTACFALSLTTTTPCTRPADHRPTFERLVRKNSKWSSCCQTGGMPFLGIPDTS